jgi:hypothetical protein
MRAFAECCNVWQVREDYYCGGLYHAFLHGAKIDRHILYSKKRIRRVKPQTSPPETTLCTLVIMMKKMDGPLDTLGSYAFSLPAYLSSEVKLGKLSPPHPS